MQLNCIEREELSNKKLILSVTIFLLLSQIIPMVTLKQTNSTRSTLMYNDLFQEAFEFTPEELTLLQQNDFIVLNRKGTDDILDAYRYYWEADLPIMITTDTILHTWHLIFDETLVKTETMILAPLLNNLTHAMVNTLTTNFPDPDPIVNDVLIYIAVAEKLINDSSSPPAHITDVVNQIVTAIINEISIYDAVTLFSDNQTARFIDDFSQYKPRGHYTRSEELMRYFRLFKWLSRIPFFFDHYCSESILKRTPEKMIQSAVLLVWALKNTRVQVGETLQTGIKIWRLFKEFLDVLIGKTYAVSPIILDQVCKDVTGETDWNPSSIMSDPQLIDEVQEIILTNNSIPEPKDLFIVDGLVLGCRSSPKMFLFFGERLTIDSYVLGHLVDPYVPSRLLPNGLDVAATCLNSERAQQLVEGAGYLDQIVKLNNEIDDWDSQDKQTVCWEWIESMSHLTKNKPELNETGQKNIPAFMQSGPWMDEKLTTVLGSYAQLRHDTILYTKQSITAEICSTPEGYVEPYPEFYKTLGNICRVYKESIEALHDLEDRNEMDYMFLMMLDGMYLFMNAMEKLEAIAYRELKGEPLTQAEQEFIKNTYCEARNICGGPFIKGWLSRIIGYISGSFRVELFPNTRSSLIADIHTDLKTGNVLEIATGVMEHLIVKVPGWNNSQILAVGPVFSYYEFITPITYRMTDEDWRGILADRFKGNEEYNYSLFQRGYWGQSYMASTEMTTDIIYQFEKQDQLASPEWVYTNLEEKVIDPYSSYTLVSYITDDTTTSPDTTPILTTSNPITTTLIPTTSNTQVTSNVSGFINPLFLLIICVSLTLYARKQRR